jgi:hypothetical protein
MEKRHETREKRPMAARESSKMSTPPNFDPAEFAKFANMQTETFLEMQKEVSALIEQANRDWLARAEKERLMAADLATKLSTVGSLPDIAKVYQEWMNRRMELIAEDSQKFFANSQKVMNSTLRLLSNGWQVSSSSR